MLQNGKYMQWILVTISMMTVNTITTEQHDIISVAATTPPPPPLPLESLSSNTINHLLNQIQMWQRNHHHEQQQQLPNYDEEQGHNHQHQSSSISSSPSSSPVLRPFVTATFAQSIDGYMSPLVVPQKNERSSSNTATTTHGNYPLSSPDSLRLTHGLRSIHDGILIGGRTLLLDNPRLTNRLWGTSTCKNNNNDHSSNNILSPTTSSNPTQLHQPQPIVIDPNLRYLIQLLNETTNNSNNNNKIGRAHV